MPFVNAFNGPGVGSLSLMFAGNPVVTGAALVALGLVALAVVVTVLVPVRLLLSALLQRVARRLLRRRRKL